MTDGAVLPRRIAPLQDDEQRVAGVGVEDALQPGDPVGLLGGLPLDRRAVAGRVVRLRGRVGEVDAGASGEWLESHRRRRSG